MILLLNFPGSPLEFLSALFQMHRAALDSLPTMGFGMRYNRPIRHASYRISVTSPPTNTAGIKHFMVGRDIG